MGTKTAPWRVDQLDPKKLFEVVPNTDPETSARFSLPIPNWLDENGNPKYEHPDLIQKEKSDGSTEWRLSFFNYEDNVNQAVKIDGNGSIIIASPTPGQCDRIKKFIAERVEDVRQLTPEHVVEVLEWALHELGRADRYNENIQTLDRKMMPVGDFSGHFGPYVYHPGKLPVSATIFIPGVGSFQGPAPEPQNFEEGAFITFRGMTKKQATRAIKEFDPYTSDNMPARLVSKAVFTQSRRHKDGSYIKVGELEPQTKKVRNYKKIRPLGGFPELSPELNAVQRAWAKSIEETYSSHGGVFIDTREIEELPTLLEQGEDADKEIYLVKPTSESEGNERERPLALRFDLTVPTARYIAQHYSDLTFPFRRAQIGKVRRADAPKTGRYREFYQCDYDVIGDGHLPIEYDAEMPRIMHELTTKLDLNVELGMNNRRIYQGFFEGNGIEGSDVVQAIRIVDKLDKIGDEGVACRLSEELDLSSTVIDKALQLAAIKTPDGSFADQVMALGIDNPLLREGVSELSTVMRLIEDLPQGFAFANLRVARGLDYYTGTVYEGTLPDYPEAPAPLAGGRYDDLASRFMARKLPGVGISFGLSRVFNYLVAQNAINPGPSTPTQVLVSYQNNTDSDMKRAMEHCKALRERGIVAEMYYGSVQEQMQYANKKGIPYVLFETDNAGNPFEIRDMRASHQMPVDFKTWEPR